MKTAAPYVTVEQSGTLKEENMKIYIIRHGETEWNTLRKLQGRTDIELNPVGIQLAKITAQAMKDIPFDVAYTSPLKRAKKTAEIMVHGRNIPLIEDERLREVCFGEYEGLGCGKENYQIPDPEFEYFFQAPEKYVAKKGAESIDELCKRTGDFMKELTSNQELEHKTVLVSTHGAALKGLLNYVTKADRKDFWGQGVHKNCGVTELESHNGVVEILQENKIYYPEHMGTKPTFTK